MPPSRIRSIFAADENFYSICSEFLCRNVL